MLKLSNDQLSDFLIEVNQIVDDEYNGCACLMHMNMAASNICERLIEEALELEEKK